MGDHYLEGGSGNDTYVFGKGYGHDVVDAYDTTAGRREMIRLVGLVPEDVEFGLVNRSGFMDFVVRIKETGETMTVKFGGGGSSDYWINTVEFGDGTVWEREEIFRHGLYGTAANEILTLYSPDLLDGGRGYDTLNGGAGDDTYIFRLGDGRDTINNEGGGNDLLKFGDINPAELWFGYNGPQKLHMVLSSLPSPKKGYKSDNGRCEETALGGI